MANEKEKESRFELYRCYFCQNSRGEQVTFRCIKRTYKTVTLKDVNFDKVVKVRMYENSEGVEYCYPMGRYISKPILFASNKVVE